MLLLALLLLVAEVETHFIDLEEKELFCSEDTQKIASLCVNPRVSKPCVMFTVKGCCC